MPLQDSYTVRRRKTLILVDIRPGVRQSVGSCRHASTSTCPAARTVMTASSRNALFVRAPPLGFAALLILSACRPSPIPRGTVVPIEVIVKLAPAAAVSGSPARRAVDACVADLDVALAPLHPSTTDRELATFLVAQVEPGTLDAALSRLRRCAGVEGAYPKPPGEPPGRM